ncbi:hypothetical protein OBBRIDRAFT_430353 [Obba rivulosa]|uniref:Uncharacterized protein n=1 Tax=Obba rivulosa TaxID=1052685 RepID=A0A8E2B2E1_9APHY|nr:hypothetical protein OBBRIDRAFT_430353 [Obba rivulosa]
MGCCVSRSEFEDIPAMPIATPPAGTRAPSQPERSDVGGRVERDSGGANGSTSPYEGTAISTEEQPLNSAAEDKMFAKLDIFKREDSYLPQEGATSGSSNGLSMASDVEADHVKRQHSADHQVAPTTPSLPRDAMERTKPVGSASTESPSNA